MKLEWKRGVQDAIATHKSIVYSVEQGSGNDIYWAFIGSQLAGQYNTMEKAMARCETLSGGK